MKLFVNAMLPTTSTALKRVNVLFEEKIVKISADEIPCEETPEVIDLQGKILLPGAVDAHTHILGQGDPAKSISRVTRAALTGGWTTCAELSYFNPQPIFSVSDMRKLGRIIDEHSFVDMALWGNIDMADYPYHAEAAQELWNHGAAGIALMTPSPNPEIPSLSFTEIMDIFVDIYVSDTGFAFQGYDYENAREYSFLSQSDAIKKVLRRMQENPIHIPRISSFATIEFIGSISKRSDISFALCIADLMKIFCGIDLGQQIDLDDPESQLFTLLRTNKISMLGNNIHAEKVPEGTPQPFLDTSEKLLPYSYLWVLSELWKKRRVPLATVIKMTSENAAKRLGLYPVKGCLEAGSDADFVIYDPDKVTHFTAPDGSQHELTGSFTQIYLKGKLAHSKGKTAAASGSFLPRHTNPKRRHNNITWI